MNQVLPDQVALQIRDLLQPTRYRLRLIRKSNLWLVLSHISCLEHVFRLRNQTVRLGIQPRVYSSCCIWCAAFFVKRCNKGVKLLILVVETH